MTWKRKTWIALGLVMVAAIITWQAVGSSYQLEFGSSGDVGQGAKYEKDKHSGDESRGL